MRRRAWLVAALALLALPAGAQETEARIERARDTLARIVRLLEQVEARQAAGRAQAAAAQPAGAWTALFDGATLAGWARTDFDGGGPVRVEPAFRGGPPAVVVEAGARLSGFHRTVEPPTADYEVELEALKIEGSDFLCGLTFPVGDAHASFIVGGWGGMVVGLSSIDGRDASENETTEAVTLQKDRWYRIRVRVAAGKIEAWLDDRQTVNVTIGTRRIHLRFGEIGKSTPLGIATYQTAAAFRQIRLRRLPPAPGPPRAVGK